MRIGEKLRVLRDKAGLTQEELADKANISIRTLQRIEANNNANKKSLRKICDVLNISTEYLEAEYNEKQYEAVTSKADNLLVIAGAGSGKTKVVTGRINYLIKNKIVRPGEILTITYTEKAAEEMQIRTSNILDKEELFEGKSEMIIGTIHSSAIQLLDKYTEKYRGFTVLSPIQQVHFIQKNWNVIGIDKIKKINTENCKNINLRKYIDTKIFLDIINIVSENKVNIEKVPVEIRDAIKKYKELLWENKYFDFTTIQSCLLSEIKNNNDFRKNIKNNIKYIIIDEYQDINHIQDQIITEFSNLAVKLTAVGDADQCIYSFRGSNIEYILNFEKKYDNSEIVELNKNFRSTNAIVELANTVIENNNLRRKRDSYAENKTYEFGDIVYKFFNDEIEDNSDINRENESKFICDRIEELINLGVNIDNIAILLRVNSMANSIIGEMDKRGIKYQVDIVNKLLEAKEIQFIKDMFAFVANKLTLDELLISGLNSGLGINEKNIKNAVDGLMKWIPEEWSKKKTAYQEYLLQEIYQEFLKNLKIYDRDTEESECRFYNLGKMSELIQDYEVIYFNTPPNIKINQFNEFLRNGANSYYPEGYLNNKNESAVKIMSIHKSKGLEFTAVFMPGLTNNIFPIKKKSGVTVWHFLPKESILNSGDLIGENKEEDERRVFYVGATRSKKFLFLTGGQYNKIAKKRSIFIDEALQARGYIFEFDNKDNKIINRNKFNDVVRDISDLVITFTDLSNYIICPYKYKLLKCYGFKQPISFRMGYGDSMHNITRRINNLGKEGNLSSINNNQIEDIVNNNFHLNYIGHLKDTENDMREKALKATKKYICDNKKDFQYIQSVEKNIEILIKECNATILGRIDVVLKKDLQGKESVHIVDYKTGDKKLNNEEYEVQTLIYSLGYKNDTNSNPDFREVYDLDDTKVIFTRTVNNKNLDDIRERIISSVKGIKENKLNTICNVENCRSCNSREICFKEKN